MFHNTIVTKLKDGKTLSHFKATFLCIGALRNYFDIHTCKNMYLADGFHSFD